MPKLDDMKDKELKSIVVLTGAGISAESGIETFRDSDGLWENHRLEDVATPQAFLRDPKLVHRFYNARRRQLIAEVEANLAHRALASFEEAFEGSFTLVTQNVDNLHEQAGSKNVLHMHGELLKVRCVRSERVFPWDEDLGTHTLCSCCQSPGNLRPHIVWFGEIPFHMKTIEEALLACDLFVSIGTSGHVYPAAGFVQLANRVGAHTVELNLEPSAGESQFADGHYGLATEEVSKFFGDL